MPVDDDRGLIPLSARRYNKVAAVLRQHKCSSLLDAGAGEGCLVYHLLSKHWQDYSLNLIVAMDVDVHALASGYRGDAIPGPFAHTALLHPCQVMFVGADLASRQRHPTEESYSELLRNMLPGGGVDCIASVEVIEHLYAEDVPRYVWNLVVDIGQRLESRVLILTTPNRDANHFYNRSEAPPTMRHPDHKFEWTGSEFRLLLDYLISAKAVRDYWCVSELFFLGGRMMTQGFVLSRKSCAIVCPCGDDEGAKFKRFEANFPPELLRGMSSSTCVPRTPALAPIGTVELVWMPLWWWIREALVSSAQDQTTRNADLNTEGRVSIESVADAPEVVRLLEQVSLAAVRGALLNSVEGQEQEGYPLDDEERKKCVGCISTCARIVLDHLDICEAQRVEDDVALAATAGRGGSKHSDLEGTDECKTFSRVHCCTYETHFEAKLEDALRCRKRPRTSPFDEGGMLHPSVGVEVGMAAAGQRSRDPGICATCIAVLFVAALASGLVATCNNDRGDEMEVAAGTLRLPHDVSSLDELALLARRCSFSAPQQARRGSGASEFSDVVTVDEGEPSPEDLSE